MRTLRTSVFIRRPARCRWLRSFCIVLVRETIEDAGVHAASVPYAHRDGQDSGSRRMPNPRGRRRQQSTHRPVDHLGQLVNRHHRGPTGQGPSESCPTVGGVNDRSAARKWRPTAQNSCPVEMDGVSNAQSLGLSHEGFPHRPCPMMTKRAPGCCLRINGIDRRRCDGLCAPPDGPRPARAASSCPVGRTTLPHRRHRRICEALVRQLFLLVVVVH